MADAKRTLQDKMLNPLNILEQAKEKIETALNQHNHHDKETHGLRNDINENTPLTDVKAPNVFERAKEEIEALVETIHQKMEAKTNGERDQATKPETSDSLSEKEAKAPNLLERAKEELEAIITNYEKSQNHHRETHGRSDDIDESTPIDAIKAPNVFERAKEEMEAIVETIISKKQSSSIVSPSEKETALTEKERGFWSSIGKWLETLCSPGGSKRD